MTISRRQFLRTTAAASAALGTAPMIHAADKAKVFRTALIGSGWWGMNVLREAIAAGRSKVVGLCDVDEDKLEMGAEHVEDLNGDVPRKYKDYRELLEKEDVEIAIIAAPDHWHALTTIAAIRAGAHVYVEKPTGHTILESRAMVDAAEPTDRVVQVGLHRRIGPHHVSAMKFLRDGNAGEIGMVRAFYHGRGGKEMPTRNSEPPAGLDWDMYCGPAPPRPFCRKIHPGGFRHFLDFANGTLGDWGVHWIDQILWWADGQMPRAVYSTGGRPIAGQPILDDQQQTTDAPDSQVAVYEFESFTATWEHRRFAGSTSGRSNVGCFFDGTKGTLHIGWRDGWTFYPANARESTVHEDPQLQEPDGHNMKLLWADFLAAIDTGSPPACSIDVGHRSTTLSLLGMLSLKLGRGFQWDADQEQSPDEDANALLRRDYRDPWEYPS